MSSYIKIERETDARISLQISGDVDELIESTARVCISDPQILIILGTAVKSAEHALETGMDPGQIMIPINKN